jgi:hypothetical protein
LSLLPRATRSHANRPSARGDFAPGGFFPPEIGSAGALGLLDPRPSLCVARTPGNRIALPAAFVATTAPRSSQLHPSFLARTLPAPVYKGDPPSLSSSTLCCILVRPTQCHRGKASPSVPPQIFRRRWRRCCTCAPSLVCGREASPGPGEDVRHRSIALAADPPRVDARRRRFVILGTDLLLRFDGPSIRFSPGSDGDLGSGSSSGMVRPWPPPWGWVAPLRASVRLGEGWQP